MKIKINAEFENVNEYKEFTVVEQVQNKKKIHCPICGQKHIDEEILKSEWSTSEHTYTYNYYVCDNCYYSVAIDTH